MQSKLSQVMKLMARSNETITRAEFQKQQQQRYQQQQLQQQQQKQARLHSERRYPSLSTSHPTTTNGKVLSIRNSGSSSDNFYDNNTTNMETKLQQQIDASLVQLWNESYTISRQIIATNTRLNSSTSKRSKNQKSCSNNASYNDSNHDNNNNNNK
jgi:hypothetical protein